MKKINMKMINMKKKKKMMMMSMMMSMMMMSMVVMAKINNGYHHQSLEVLPLGSSLTSGEIGTKIPPSSSYSPDMSTKNHLITTIIDSNKVRPFPTSHYKRWSPTPHPSQVVEEQKTPYPEPESNSPSDKYNPILGKSKPTIHGPGRYYHQDNKLTSKDKFNNKKPIPSQVTNPNPNSKVEDIIHRKERESHEDDPIKSLPKVKSIPKKEFAEWEEEEASPPSSDKFNIRSNFEGDDVITEEGNGEDGDDYEDDEDDYDDEDEEKYYDDEGYDGEDYDDDDDEPDSDPHLDSSGNREETKDIQGVLVRPLENPTKHSSSSSSSVISKELEREIMRLVPYAGAAYCPDPTIEAWNCRYCQSLWQTTLHKIFHDNLTSTHALLTIDEPHREFVLSYRGAEGFMKLLYVASEAQLDFPHFPGARVNGNYLRSVQSIQNQIHREFSRLLIQPRYADYRIRLVGHSLGGALALLAAPILHFDLGIPTSRLTVTTYGMPRVGDLPFVHYYLNLNLTVTRIVNGPDGITQHPSYGTYRHVPHEIQLRDTTFRHCRDSKDEDPHCSFGTPLLTGFFEHHLKVADLLVTELGC